MSTNEQVKKVIATDAALELIEQLKAEHGALMFHQSGGCCDGSTPMCLTEGELIIGSADVLLGEIGGCLFISVRLNTNPGNILSLLLMSHLAQEMIFLLKVLMDFAF